MRDSDAMKSAGLVVAVAETESTFKRFARKSGVAELLGRTATAAELGVTEAAAAASIEELLDHIRALPGAASIMVYARDRSLVWASYGAKGRSTFRTRARTRPSATGITAPAITS